MEAAHDAAHQSRNNRPSLKQGGAVLVDMDAVDVGVVIWQVRAGVAGEMEPVPVVVRDPTVVVAGTQHLRMANIHGDIASVRVAVCSLAGLRNRVDLEVIRGSAIYRADVRGTCGGHLGNADHGCADNGPDSKCLTHESKFHCSIPSVRGAEDSAQPVRSEFAGSGKPTKHAADRLDAQEQPDRAFEVVAMSEACGNGRSSGRDLVIQGSALPGYACGSGGP